MSLPSHLIHPQITKLLGHGVLGPRSNEHKLAHVPTRVHDTLHSHHWQARARLHCVGNDVQQQEPCLEQRDDLVLTLGVKNETMNVQQSHRFHWLGWPWNMGGIHVWDLFGSSSFSIACAYNFSPHVPFFPNPHLSCRYYITSLLSFS